MHLLRGVALLLLLPATLLAQNLPPALTVPAQDGRAGAHDTLGLSRLALRVRVSGFIAETRMTMTFRNPFDRVLEGELLFPLPEGATVSGYALDIDGQLVDGVVVEKDKARIVFEKEVRKGVDPGIVEWVKGNTFRTRVYPIPARGTRTVAVRYVTNLAVSDKAVAYQLPLNLKEPLDEVSLQIEVARGSGSPLLKWPGPTLELRPRGDGLGADVTLKKRALVGTLELVIPLAQTPKAIVERSPEGELHFVINDWVSDPRGTAAAEESRAPRRVVVLWDASGSRAGVDHSRELALLRAYFARYPTSRIDTELVTFRNVAAKPQAFAIQGDPSALLSAVSGINYDGGTQLGTIAPGKADKPADLYLLFSDGMSTFGPDEPRGFAAPVYAIANGLGLNPTFLRRLSESTGGEYLDLGRVDPALAARRIGGSPFSLVGIEVSGGKVEEVFPRPGQPIVNQLVITGRLVGESVNVKVNLGAKGKSLTSKTYTVARSAASSGNLLARFWAQQKAGELSVSPQRNAEALVALGKRYNLVTPGTSLIVLERLDQYVEHDIRPPATLVAMRTQWDQLMAARAEEEKKRNQSKLEHILALWHERVEWWERKFKYPKNLRVAEVEPSDDRPSRRRSGNGGHGEDAGVAESMPPPSARREIMDAPAPSLAEEAKTDAAEKSKAKDSGEANAPEPGIELAPWDPDTPYLRALKAASGEAQLRVYFAERQRHGHAPAFFLDVADFFFKQKKNQFGMQVLSNIAELRLEDAPLLRVLAHRLAELDELELAASIFEEVLRLRPEEPQSYRDLALVLARLKQYERAMELLAHVIMNQWDRFDAIEVIALMELNTIIPKARAAGIEKIPVDPRLVKLLDLDVRISLTWDADLTDIDLWVIEPSGEKTYYADNLSTIGGLVSRDFTQGYGPEEYVLRRAMPGKYVVQTNFYGSGAQTLTGAVTLQLDLFTNFGRPNEKHKSITLRLSEAKETFTVGTLEF